MAEWIVYKWTITFRTSAEPWIFFARPEPWGDGIWPWSGRRWYRQDDGLVIPKRSFGRDSLCGDSSDPQFQKIPQLQFKTSWLQFFYFCNLYPSKCIYERFSFKNSLVIPRTPIREGDPSQIDSNMTYGHAGTPSPRIKTHQEHKMSTGLKLMIWLTGNNFQHWNRWAWI